MKPSLAVTRLRVAVVGVGLVSALWAGCSPDLGQAPFKCNTGTPKCPDGYQCNPAKLCVPEGTCPVGLPGCATQTCGDGTCDAKQGETCKTCEKDCGKCQAGCGDGTCDAKQGETCKTCPADCKACPVVCGDGKCEGDEKTTCPEDCSTTTCGNGQCESGETVSNCPIDCKAKPVCGDGKCELPEIEATCPKDCKPAGCTDGETHCVDADTLKYCDTGAWKTDTCESICSTKYDYTMGCKPSPKTSKDVCICDNYAGFGEICDGSVKCKAGQICAVYGTTATKGFCTKACVGVGSPCSAAPPFTQAVCSNSMIGGQHVCVFTCDFFTQCPQGMTCGFDGLCKP